MRVDLVGPWPDGYRALDALDRAVTHAFPDRRLLELAMLRTSQINGCAYCVDMHAKNVLALGEDADRLHLVTCWRETDSFDGRERAALGLAEAVARVADGGVPDATVDAARAQFTAAELAQLIVGLALTNAWNRFALTMRPPVGGYSRRPGLV